MADPRDPALKAAVARLMRDTESLSDLFLLNHGNEANRQKLRDGFEPAGSQIKNNLRTLIGKTPLKPALDKPNSAYNQFISAWNNGTGDLTISFYRINEFGTLLRDAQPALDRLMVLRPGTGPQPTGPRGTPAERTVFTTLRTQTDELYRVFEAYLVNNHKPPSAPSTIKEHVNVIGQQFNNSSLGQQALTALANPKTEWVKFTSLYKNGNGIEWNCLKQLGEFKTIADMACIRFLG
jgi:hypothetical protein